MIMIPRATAQVPPNGPLHRLPIYTPSIRSPIHATWERHTHNALRPVVNVSGNRISAAVSEIERESYSGSYSEW